MRMSKGWNLLVVSAVALSLCGVPGEAMSQEEEESEELVGDVENGEKVVTEEIECIGCHTIEHKGTGINPVGPDLTMVGLRRSKEWLTTFESWANSQIYALQEGDIEFDEPEPIRPTEQEEG